MTRNQEILQNTLLDIELLKIDQSRINHLILLTEDNAQVNNDSQHWTAVRIAGSTNTISTALALALAAKEDTEEGAALREILMKATLKLVSF